MNGTAAFGKKAVLSCVFSGIGSSVAAFFGGVDAFRRQRRVFAGDTGGILPTERRCPDADRCGTHRRRRTPQLLCALPHRPAAGEVRLCVLPPETMVEDAGRFDSAAAVWHREGGARGSEAIARVLGCRSDRWLELDADAFRRLCIVVGALDYTLEQPLVLPGRHDGDHRGQAASRRRQARAADCLRRG